MVKQVKELARAEGKKSRPEYWGTVGEIESVVIARLRAAINALPLDMPPEEFRKKILDWFEGELDRLRNDDYADPDGFGLGALYLIMENGGLGEGDSSPKLIEEAKGLTSRLLEWGNRFFW